ncbi:MAG: 5-formyltetrahydrofolate cyclo-ligase [Streptococcaceae bacterium]|jgi:5-formyltetrahydrofolate cyclo-ligase|nr:5-formyltetrahydrofolate cyclo-ligase [Streptococcaceae bacterium]
MKKDKLRKQTIIDLQKLSENPAAKQMLENKLHQKLFTSPEWKNAQTIGLTISQQIEINTKPIITKAWSEGKAIVIPKTQKKPVMDFYQYEQNAPLQLTKYGLLEPIGNEKKIAPDSIDLLIVPGLIFHQKGYRIGFGGGFYDAYLAQFHGVTLSLAFPFQLNSNWQPEIFDQPVDKIITNGVTL